MSKKWEEVINTDEYKQLETVQKEQARNQYFEQVVQPKLLPEQVEMAKNQFFSFDDSLKTSDEKVSKTIMEFGKNFFSDLSLTGGVVVGLARSPLAFVLGSQEAAWLDPEQYNKLPFWKQALVSTGGGFESAWNGITEKGSFGTTYGDYYKSVTGTTIRESLPDNFKWADLTIEFIAETVLDPLFIGSGIGKLASFKVPKDFIGKLPQNVVNDLERINKLGEADKAQLRRNLLDVLKNRAGYIKWWEENSNKIDDVKNAKRLLAESVPGSKNLLPPAQGFELVNKPYKTDISGFEEIYSRFDFLSKKESLTAEQLGELGELKKLVKTSLSKNVPEKLDILIHGDAERVTEFSKLNNVTRHNKLNYVLTDAIKQPLDESIALAQHYDKYVNTNPEKAQQFLELSEIQKTKALNNAWKVLQTEDKQAVNMVKKILGSDYDVKEIGLAKSSGGLVFGVSEDENGNLTYDYEKGLLGALGVAGGLSLLSHKKALVTLSKNPAWTKVHNMVGEAKTSGLTFSGVFAKLNQALFDRFAAIKKVSEDGYKSARMFSAYKDQAFLTFGELKDKLVKVKDSEVLFTDYVLAHRAVDRSLQGFKNPNGVTLPEARQAIKEMETHWAGSGRNIVDLKQSLVNFKNFTVDNILTTIKNTGIISQKTFDEIKNTNQWYATFDVLDKVPVDFDLSVLPSGEFLSVNSQKVLKSLVGTEKLIDNPIKSTIKKFISVQELFNRNRIASMIIDDAEVTGMFKPLAETVEEFNSLKKLGKNPVFFKTLDKNEFDVVARLKDGFVEKYAAPRFIADSMKQLNPSQVPRVLSGLKNIINFTNNVFRTTATTAYLPFTVSNAFRDALMAYTTSPVYKPGELVNYSVNWSKGLFEAGKFEFLGKSDLVKDYLKSGGGFGFVGELNKNKTVGLFNKTNAEIAKSVVKSPFTLIKKISESVELASRLGVFQKARMVGYNDKNAALAARAATIDFSRAGTLTKVLNQFIPFLNARVQSGVTLAEGIKKNPLLTLSKVFTGTVIPGVSLYAWNRLYYSKEYEDIPRNIKDNYFIGIVGTVKENGVEKPKYIAIPKGEVGIVGFNPIEYALDKSLKTDREKTTEFLIGFLSDSSPVSFVNDKNELSPSRLASNFLPPIVKGAVENWANLSFYTGNELVPYYTRKNKPPELQFKDNTPETYKWLGSKLNMSPIMLQNFASNVLAGYGREGLDPSAMIRGLTGRLVKTTSGEINNKAWTAIKDIEQGYVYTRAYAEEFIKNGEKEKAKQLLNGWNKGLQKRIEEYNKEFSPYGLRDKGGLVKSYRFTPEKRKNLFMKKPERISLEERLIPGR